MRATFQIPARTRRPGSYGRPLATEPFTLASATSTFRFKCVCVDDRHLPTYGPIVIRIHDHSAHLIRLCPRWDGSGLGRISRTIHGVNCGYAGSADSARTNRTSPCNTRHQHAASSLHWNHPPCNSPPPQSFDLATDWELWSLFLFFDPLWIFNRECLAGTTPPPAMPISHLKAIDHMEVVYCRFQVAFWPHPPSSHRYYQQLDQNRH